jgi:hypothetical protein
LPLSVGRWRTRRGDHRQHLRELDNNKPSRQLAEVLSPGLEVGHLQSDLGRLQPDFEQLLQLDLGAIEVRRRGVPLVIQ